MARKKPPAEITRESLIEDLLANLKDAQGRGNLAQANRSLQILQGLLKEDDTAAVEVSEEDLKAQLDDVLFNDDLLREHIRRRLDFFDRSREGIDPSLEGEAPSLDLLSPIGPSILFPEGFGDER